MQVHCFQKNIESDLNHVVKNTSAVGSSDCNGWAQAKC